MTLKKLRKRLAAEADKAGICREWREKILTAPSREFLLTLFIKGLDFAILNNFPSDELAAEFADIAPHYGIFINQAISDSKPHKTTIARNAAGKVTVNRWSVGEVYALRGSEVEIEATGHACLYVTIEAGAKVRVTARHWAKVRILQHGGEVQTEAHDNAQINNLLNKN